MFRRSNTAISISSSSPEAEKHAEAAAAADAQLLPIWQGLYDTVNSYLDGITLQSIIDRKMESYDYSI